MELIATIGLGLLSMLRILKLRSAKVSKVTAW